MRTPIESTLITKINDVPDISTPRMSRSATEIPDKYRNKIRELIDEMEAELGQQYFININQTGKNMTEIYPLSERKRAYQVTMIEPKFQELNGKYLSLNQIKERIADLACIDLQLKCSVKLEKVNGKYTWKCPSCDSYGKTELYSVVDGSTRTFDRINKMPATPYDIQQCCTCNYDPKFSTSEWLNIKIFPESGIVGETGGGRMPVITKLGNIIAM